MGRRRTYGDDIKAIICDRLAAGESLLAICKGEGMPSEAVVRKWAIEDAEGFGATYARARDFGLDHHADKVLEVADNEGGDPVRDRLRFEARRWYLSKLAPRRYGEKVGIEHSGSVTLEGLVVGSLNPSDIK